MKKVIKINIRFFLLLATLFCCVSCTGKKTYGEEDTTIYIQRFDVDFYRYLQDEIDFSDLAVYTNFLNVYGENVLNIGSSEDPGFQENVKSYFSNPAIQDLYRTEQELFTDISSSNSELSRGLNLFLKEFPAISKPQIYMHVSGWEQKIIVTDDILSLSADFYLGSDYPYYQHFFYDYQRKNMNPDRIVPDYLMGFMMANFPLEGKEDVLLDRMLYEGKLAYILSRLLPDRQEWEYVSYSKEEYDWCQSNRSQIWSTILENQHFFTPNLRVVSQYIREAPHTVFLSEDSPGRVGVWLGYQIITSYMKHNPDISLSELMQKSDYQEMLKESRFKP